MDNEQIYFSLGSNVGDRKHNLKHALKHLNSNLNIDLISSIYETSPQGYKDQSNFYNLACSTKKQIDMYELLGICKEIEIHCGRTSNFINGPRILDIDIISYGDQLFEKTDLIIPHPRMDSRLFVLIPLAEINPLWVHPKLNVSIEKLIKLNQNQGEILNIGKLQ
ncbi:MAG: 2-amino-4-hydroxy-6-hydroxymethyldihydropteridine diphosphokinase [Dehalococcoidia bacterium]